MKKIDQVIDQLKEQGAILIEKQIIKESDIYLFSLNKEVIVVIDDFMTGKIKTLEERKEEPVQAIKTDFTKEAKAAFDIKILTQAVDHYFEPILQNELKPSVKESTTKAKDNLILRVRERFIIK